MKKFLSPSEISKLEDVHRTTVIGWVHGGEFENVRRVGNRFRVPLESYQKWREKSHVVVQTV